MLPTTERVRVDGKQFTRGGRRFRFRGVTYGTFAPRGDGERFPERDQMKKDLAAMHEAGFTVLRTYTLPPDDLLDLAADWDIQVLAGVFYSDWRYLVGMSRKEARQVRRAAIAEVRAASRRLAGNEMVLGIVLGNEVPADAVRWLGTRRVAGVIDDLADVVRSEDSDQLVTYGNYPTTEYLPLRNLDFVMFNVYLERQVDLRRYLTRLHHLAGDRPLVLGEMGLHAGNDAAGEQRQAEFLDWQFETALERGVAGTCVFSWTDDWWVGGHQVEGWRLGLTRGDRSPRPALDVAARWNRTRVSDLDVDWPSISVVICAHNAAATLDECLRHTCALDYPELEVIVVDDGSTDATADIARRYRRARLVRTEHAGLAAARNEGLEVARGDLVAYLDSDAFPAPEWPFYLALGMDSHDVAGVGGPNVPPPNDPPGAHQVAQAPGGPVHVLVADDRAEHVPGCNMAFWKQYLVDIGGFDPVFTAAGDDVDVCWRVLDRGWEIGFHPAALVWHRRRPGLRPYLGQQRGYGRSEALVEARHPDRFTVTGSARWRGRIYNSLSPRLARQRVYRGQYGAAAYQSVYGGGGSALDLLHQAGVPVAAVTLATAPLGLLLPVLALPALAALGFLVTLATCDFARAAPRSRGRARLRFRAAVAAMHLLQPLVRSWSRLRSRAPARRDVPVPLQLRGPVVSAPGGAVITAYEGPREELAAGVVAAIHRAGVRVLPATGWETYDARVIGSVLVRGDLVTSAYPEGCVQLRVRQRPRGLMLSLLVTATAVAATVNPALALGLAGAGAIEFGRGLWRTGPLVRRVVREAAS